MTDPKTRQFILDHHGDDPHALALHARRFPDIDMVFAVEQIAGWQKAKGKLPSWAACDDIVYPAHLALEQCSSETTALYKARLCQRLLGTGAPETASGVMADLTGGMGVDFSFLAPLFQRAIYIERQPALCQCARHNFQALQLGQAEVWEGDSMQLLEQLPNLQLLFIDPARRDKNGLRTHAIGDCSPDILPVLPELLDKANFLMVKLSPMLDWHETVRSLEAVCPNCVGEVHLVATANECKELLVILSRHDGNRTVRICCANDDDLFITDTATEQTSTPLPVVGDAEEAMAASWLYEPNAAVMKAGCFSTLTQRFPVRALSANSHLFLSNTRLDGFPGRELRILRSSTMNKRQLQACLGDIRQANITMRNFPLSVAELRKRLHIADGGDIYIFASTVAKRDHLIFVCNKA